MPLKSKHIINVIVVGEKCGIAFMVLKHLNCKLLIKMEKYNETQLFLLKIPGIFSINSAKYYSVAFSE